MLNSNFFKLYTSGIPKPKPISRITDESRSNRSSVISSDEEEQQTTKVETNIVVNTNFSTQYVSNMHSQDNIFYCKYA